MKLFKKYTHDKMSLTAKFPTGGTLHFSVGRGGERLEVAFSNNDAELKEQTETVKEFVKFRYKEVNQGRFDRLESLLNAQGGCKSGRGVVARMRYELDMLDEVENA